MSALQWALLLLGIGGIMILVVSGRRGTRTPGKSAARTASEPQDPGTGEGFDQFGVGRARRRGAPSPRKTPVLQQPSSAEPDIPFEVQPAPAPEKILTLFIAEQEGSRILGARLHAALQAQGLQYNARNKAYDRVEGEVVHYSVTSLTAPGYLDAAEAHTFSTPGLAMFMRLPGPPDPKAAFQDMLRTAHALSLSLSALLFDGNHKPLTEERVGALSAEVEAWARRYAH